MNIVAECSIFTGSGQHSQKRFLDFLQANELLIELAQVSCNDVGENSV